MKYQADERQQISHLHQVMNPVKPAKIRWKRVNIAEDRCSPRLMYRDVVHSFFERFSLTLRRDSRNKAERSALGKVSRVSRIRTETLRSSSGGNRPSGASKRLLTLSPANICTAGNIFIKRINKYNEETLFVSHYLHIYMRVSSLRICKKTVDREINLYVKNLMNFSKYRMQLGKL